ncbi:MAG TPA: helix-turn-helix domain-containing protein [Candidatus Thermoplasmatota archaeon]|nr:helix-turn-helix domain-containing protein [Candidatus Thermoplasmatota archaeon]
MGFTEVVYKIRSDAWPLCTATDGAPELKAIVNTASWDPETRLCKAVYTLLGPEEKITSLADQLSPLFDRAEIVSRGKESLVLRTSARLDLLKKTANPTAFALDQFGDDAILPPALAKEGYVHTRLLLTRKVDLADLLANYEKGVKEGRWSDFKLIRIDDYDPEQQIAGSFSENLTQKQLEVIKTALALGFYNTPRDITLDDLSNIFGISKAAVHNRLQAAERKVIGKFFG